MIITASPAQAAFPINDSAPLYFWFTMGPAVAANININVPTNSAPSYTINWIDGNNNHGLIWSVRQN